MKDFFDKIDKETLEAIGRSADDIEIPERLLPKNIEAMIRERAGSEEAASEDIEEKAPAKKGFFHIYGKRIASAAAVAAAAILTVHIGVTRDNISKQAPLKEVASTEDSLTAGTGLGAVTGSVNAMRAVEKESLSVADAFKGYFYNEESVDGVKKAIEEAAEKRENVRFYKTTGDTADMEVEESAVLATDGASAKTQAAGAGSSYSTTNLREIGVDEGDIVKTDGNYIYAMSYDGDVRIIKAEGTKLTLVCTFAPSYDDVDDYRLNDMYIKDDRMILVSDTYSVSFIDDYLVSDEIKKKEGGYTITNTDRTVVAIYDISDRNAPKKAGEFSCDGNYKTSRITGGYIYLFTWYNEGNIPYILREMPTAENILLPKDKEFYQAFTMTSVALDDPSKAVDTKVIYSSCNDVYVTSDTVILEIMDYSSSHEVTKLFRFDISEGKFSPMGVGSVPGYIESSFSIDEDSNGYIRVATTTWGYSRPSTGVFVFDRNMNRTGKLTGIAKGEEIKSARFMENMLYLVTYENKDPLFSVDLSDPSAPTIIGKLDIPGFSDYLHFWDDTHLLGIGYESNEKNGNIIGAKLSLFDISNPKKVKVVATTVIKGVDEVEGMYNYRAILVNPEKNLIGFNTIDWDKNFNETKKYYVFSLSNDLNSFKNLASIKSSGLYESTRGLYIDDSFFLFTGEKLMSYDMTNAFEKKDGIKFEK